MATIQRKCLEFINRPFPATEYAIFCSELMFLNIVVQGWNCLVGEGFQVDGSSKLEMRCLETTALARSVDTVC